MQELYVSRAHTTQMTILYCLILVQAVEINLCVYWMCIIVCVAQATAEFTSIFFMLILMRQRRRRSSERPGGLIHNKVVTIRYELGVNVLNVTRHPADTNDQGALLLPSRQRVSCVNITRGLLIVTCG